LIFQQTAGLGRLPLLQGACILIMACGPWSLEIPGQDRANRGPAQGAGAHRPQRAGPVFMVRI